MGAIKQTPPGVVTQDLKHRRKERILGTISKLADRDTQRAAVDELASIVGELDADALAVLLSCLCSTGNEQKVFARKESARMLGMLGGPACPMHSLVLQQPQLGKIVSYLRSRFKDPDSSVREAAGDALGMLAENLARIKSSFASGDTATNPLLRVLFEALAEQAKEGQAAASYALSRGAVAVGPHAAAIIGQATPGAASSGLAAALSSSDWATRKAAAEALKALAIVLGPALESLAAPGSPGRDPKPPTAVMEQALTRCKFDKVVPVRKAVGEALGVLTDLQEFMKNGGGPSAWPAWSATKLTVKGAAQPEAHFTPSPSKIPGLEGRPSSDYRSHAAQHRPRSAARPASAFREAGRGEVESVHERFRRAAAEADSVAEAVENQRRANLAAAADAAATGEAGDGKAAVQNDNPTDQTATSEQPVSRERTGTPLAPLQEGVREKPAVSPAIAKPAPRVSSVDGDATGSAARPRPRRTASRPPSVDRELDPPGGWEAFGAQMQHLQEQQTRLLSLMESLAASTQVAIANVEKRMGVVEASVQQLAGRAPAQSQPPLGLGSLVISIPDAADQPAVASPSHQAASAGTIPGTSGRPTESSFPGFTTPKVAKAEVSPHTSAAPKPAPSPKLPAVRRSSSRPATPTPAADLSPSGLAAADGFGVGDSELLSPSTGDLDTVYSEALQSPTGQLRLLRLMARTGPSWADLSPATAQLLLRALANLLRERTALPRILPWFWTLADEDLPSVAVSQEQRRRIVDALAAVPDSEDLAMDGKVGLLLSTLRAVWGMPAGEHASSPYAEMPKASVRGALDRPGASASGGVRSSAEKLGAMQDQLNAMQDHQGASGAVKAHAGAPYLFAQSPGHVPSRLPPTDRAMSPPAESRLPAERTCLAGQYSLSITSETHNPQMKPCSLVDDLGLNPHKLAGYLCRIEAGYRPNPYHNSTHAADVLQSMFKIATSGGLYPGVLDRTGLLCCLLAAIVHDFEHTGLTNDYLINTEHPYALKYNDKAPQENHHVAAAFALLASPEFNFLEGFSRAERTAIRRRVIDMVLATDMKAHMEIMAQFQETLRLPRENRAGWMGRARSRVSASPLVSAFAICAAPATLSAPPESYCNTSIPEHVTLALQMAIKVADVSHLAAAFPVHYRWVKCLEEEFFLQGEHEAAQALPVTRFMDRTQAGVSKSQVGFFEVIALPMFSSFVKVFPDCQPLLDLALANYEDWRGLNNDSEAAWHQRAVVADRKRKRNVTFCQPPTSQLQGSGSHQFPVVRASISRQPTV
ncbi:hypothetical protein WJX72_006945 [[Myrmecia] bisecta]|uniref:Phosphodiesterase n=1 Tax=[Myrmecia] bisecta TaxID=41462 RepID=A0AAW1Q3L2_9CHLO